MSVNVFVRCNSSSCKKFESCGRAKSTHEVDVNYLYYCEKDNYVWYVNQDVNEVVEG